MSPPLDVALVCVLLEDVPALGALVCPGLVSRDGSSLINISNASSRPISWLPFLVLGY